MQDRRRSSRERRAARRAPFVAAVRQSAGDALTLALAQDLGESGMKLRVAPPAFASEAPVALAFELPDGGELLHVEGAVVFERADGAYRETGIRFLSLSSRDRSRIARYLDARLT
jgi:hypothetical protein